MTRRPEPLPWRIVSAALGLLAALLLLTGLAVLVASALDWAMGVNRGR